MVWVVEVPFAKKIKSMAQWRYSLFHSLSLHSIAYGFVLKSKKSWVWRALSSSIAEGIYFGKHVPLKVIGGFAAAFVALVVLPWALKTKLK